MKRMGKKFLSFLLCMCMLLSAMPISAFAGEITPEDAVQTVSSEVVEESAPVTEEATPEVIEEPVVEATEEPVVEATEEPAVEATEEPVVEATEEPAVEATEEPAVEATEEPAVEATEEPAPEVSEGMTAALEMLAALTEKYGCEYTEETYEAVLAELIAGMDEAALVLCTEDAAAFEAVLSALTDEELAQLQAENAEVLAWLDAVAAQAGAELAAQTAVSTVRAQMDALMVPEYTAETIWTAMDEMIAAQGGDAEAVLAQFAAAQEALAQLPAENKAVLEAEYSSVLSFGRLLNVKVMFDKLAADYYREFDGERWILFETMVALMEAEELNACFSGIGAGLAALETLTADEKAIFEAQYADQIAYFVELAGYIEENSVMAAAVSSSWFDTDVTGNYYNIISEKHYGLISGASEAEIVLNNSDGTRRQVVHVFRVDGSKVDILPGYYGIDKDVLQTENQKAEKVTETAKYYEKQLGYDLVGGMNIALAYDSNAPYTFLVYEGKVLQDYHSDDPLLNQHSGSCSTYLAIFKDGSVELRSKSEPLDGTEWHAVGANFGWLVKDGELVTKTPERTSSTASRSMLGILPNGDLIMCMADGRGANNSVGLGNYEMGEFMLALGCVNAVNGDGGGSSTFISKREGESSLTMRSVPSDGAERPTIHSVFLAKKGNLVQGVFDHANILAEYDYYVPSVTYTFGAQAIDTTGAEMEMPEGGVWSLSDDSFGTIDENGTFVSNGTLGEVSVQYTVSATTAEKTIAIVNPTVAKFALDSTVLPYGKGTALVLDIWADEDGEHPVFYQASSFDWTVSDENAGVLNLEDMTYTATEDESIAGVTITAVYKHAEMDDLVFEITYGKGSEIIAGWDFEDGDVSDWMGFDEAKAWSIANNLQNTLVGSDPLAGQYSPENYARTFLATNSNGQVKNGSYALGVELDYMDSAFSGWSYNILFNVGEKRVFRDVANGLNATTLGMWVYIPEGAPGLAMQSQFWNGAKCVQDHFMFTTVSGVRKNLNSCTEADIPDNRWVYASIDISGYDYLSTMDPVETVNNNRSLSFIRFYVKPMAPVNLTFYFDDITLDYSPAVEDREEPVIGEIMYAVSDESVAAEGATIASSSISFSASVADYVKNNSTGLNTESAKIYLDGVEVETEVSGSNMSTAVAITLENGAHTVTFEIADNLGNVAQKSASFTVEASEEKGLIYMEGHNDSGKLPEYDSVYYVDLKTDAAEEVEKVEVRIQLNTANNWEADHMIVAPGYTVEYEQPDADRDYITVARSDIHSVDNVLNIVLTRTEDCDLTGAQTLVSIPVRVWSWNGVNHVTGKPITPEQQFASGNCPIVTIDVSVLYGSVQNADGEENAFGGSMSVETMLNDTVNPWHYHTAEALTDKAATCTEDGYTGRTYCAGCASVVEWGTVVPATGHRYSVSGDYLACECGSIITGTGIVEVDGTYYYLIADKLITGWQLDEEGWCYADPSTKALVTGEKTISGLTYTFTEGGILTEGVWVVDENGTRYSYGPGFLTREWSTINGATYYFGTDSYMYTGIRCIPVNRNNPKEGYNWYNFGEDGKMFYDFADYDGIVISEVDGMHYVKAGMSYYAGLVLIDGAYYYARTSGEIVCGKGYYITKHNDLLPAAYYTFGEDGKMINPPTVTPAPSVDPDATATPAPEVKNGIVEENGVKYWYVDGEKTYGGLMLIDGAYYYARTSGEIVCGKGYYITKHNDLLPAAYYTFDADGKMVNPPVAE